jgi:superfamily II DNA or RNA helicase
MSTRVNVRASYEDFLRAKTTPGVSYDGDWAIVPEWERPADNIAEIDQRAPHLHDYQRFATAFAAARKRAALFLECGLGKTSCALAWVEQMRGGGPAVICAPLAALHEFEREREKFFPSMTIRIVRGPMVDEWFDAPMGVALMTHHAFLEHRDLTGINAFVLDESSILKSGDGRIAQSLITSVRPVPNRLAMSATPAPNDPTEYASHAHWLGYVRSDAEFTARFFIRDGKFWRPKGHAHTSLPEYLSRFCLWMRDPSVYGMPCSALPDTDYAYRVRAVADVDGGVKRDLLGTPVEMTMSDRSRLRRSLYDDDDRLEAIVNEARGVASIIWATRNDHADAIEHACKVAGIRVAQISGATKDEDRVHAVRAFQAGDIDCIVSKPKVIGHGVNLQRADRIIWAAYDESYEAHHQAIRRAHRQGRVGQLDVVMLATQSEWPVLETIKTKREEWDTTAARHEAMFAASLRPELEAFSRGEMTQMSADNQDRLPPVKTDHYTIHNDDCIAQLARMAPASIDLAVFSPPFAALFTYSSQREDMGNCSEHVDAEFAIHFSHFAERLLAVMKPGRVCALHLQQLVAFQARHGRKGLRDFRGMVISRMEDAGWIYYGEFVIPKNPQAAAIRTKSSRLQFTQFRRDSLESSPALNDYVLQFRRPGKQDVPVVNNVSNDEWINWASGVWSDIRETDVLEGWQAGRADEDEKHICPLQLEVIRRCVRLWSNPGEVVLSPFGGIGSEGYVSVKMGRRFVGSELKPSYYGQACRNLAQAKSEQGGLFAS